MKMWNKLNKNCHILVRRRVNTTFSIVQTSIKREGQTDGIERYSVLAQSAQLLSQGEYELEIGSNQLDSRSINMPLESDYMNEGTSVHCDYSENSKATSPTAWVKYITPVLIDLLRTRTQTNLTLVNMPSRAKGLLWNQFGLGKD